MYLEYIISKLRKTYSRGDVWTSGECGILADAIAIVFPQAQYYAITGFENGREVTVHIFVRLGNFYYDADGKHPVNSGASLIARWQKNLGDYGDDILGLRIGALYNWPEDVERDKNVSRYVASLIRRWYPIVEQ